MTDCGQTSSVDLINNHFVWWVTTALILKHSLGYKWRNFDQISELDRSSDCRNWSLYVMTPHLELFKLLGLGHNTEDISFCSLRVEMFIERLHRWGENKYRKKENIELNNSESVG